MEVNPEQSEKHCCPSVVTEEGIVIDFNDVQPPKQSSPREVTDDGMVMEVKFFQ